MNELTTQNQIRVLIVDDNFKVSVSLKTALVWTDKITSERVYLVEDAVQKISEQRPDVILLNLNLPDSKGLGTLARIVGLDGNIPIIILSTGNDEDIVTNAMMNGAHHYILPSQIDTETLRMAITYTISRLQQESKLRQEHAEARSAQARLAAVLQCLEDGFCQVDSENRLTYINPAAERMLGWKMDEVLGEKLHYKFHYKFPDGAARPADTCPLVHAFREGRPHHNDDDYFVRKDGTFIWIRYSSAPLVVDGQSIGGVICFQDMTEQRKWREQAEQKFQEAQQSQARMTAMLDCMRDGVCQVDTQNRITYANPSALEMLGYTSEQLLGNKLHDTLHYKFPDGKFRPVESCPLWQAFRDGRAHHDDDDYMVAKDGRLVWVEYTSAPIKLEGETIGGVICFRDNSQLKEKMRQLNEMITKKSDAAK